MFSAQVIPVQPGAHRHVKLLSKSCKDEHSSSTAPVHQGGEAHHAGCPIQTRSFATLIDLSLTVGTSVSRGAGTGVLVRAFIRTSGTMKAWLLVTTHIKVLVTVCPSIASITDTLIRLVATAMHCKGVPWNAIT